MFGFHTHEVNAIHEIESELWEETLDNIFSKITRKHKPCLGLISNTHKETITDKVGNYSTNTQFIFNEKIDPIKHDLLVMIDKDKFNRIFQEYLDFNPEDRDDYYHLKEKYEIGCEILVYPLYNKLEKKALLMLNYPTDKIILDKICNELIEILSPK